MNVIRNEATEGPSGWLSIYTGGQTSGHRKHPVTGARGGNDPFWRTKALVSQCHSLLTQDWSRSDLVCIGGWVATLDALLVHAGPMTGASNCRARQVVGVQGTTPLN